MQDELLELWERSRFTMLFVTHSIEEALLLGDRVVVMSPHPGRVAEILETDRIGAAASANPELAERIQRILFRSAPEYSI
jgi:NitT/TauT family transport system ATP-binding protein